MATAHASSILLFMSRLRRFDKAVLDLNEPLDSDDQDLLITGFIRANDDSFSLYTKILGALILIEIPILLWAIKELDPLSHASLKTMTVLLSCILTLVNLVYDVSKVGNQITSRIRSTTMGKVIAKVISFHGINLLNGILLVQLSLLIQWRLASLYYFVPVGNLITMNLLFRWHEQIKGNVKELGGLKYDYKEA